MGRGLGHGRLLTLSGVLLLLGVNGALYGSQLHGSVSSAGPVMVVAPVREPAPPRFDPRGCPDLPLSPDELGLALVGIDPWTPEHAYPLAPGERRFWRSLLERCGGGTEWGERFCAERPCVVLLALQHRLPDGVVWVDGSWRVVDGRRRGRPASAWVEESWFYLEPSAVRLPRGREPLRSDDCSVFERPRLLPAWMCDAYPDELDLHWAIEEWAFITSRGPTRAR